MRRSEYISAEYNRFIQSAEKAESRVGYHLKKMQKDEDVYKDRESQIAAIEKTFEDAKVPIEKHFNKPGVYALEVLQRRSVQFCHYQSAPFQYCVSLFAHFCRQCYSQRPMQCRQRTSLTCSFSSHFLSEHFPHIQ